MKSSSSRGAAERVAQQSAAEFFSEHQQIAGFDNAGKSLFTSIRELVENSLDAAEAIQTLPDIKIKIVEKTEAEHNSHFGIQGSRSDKKNKEVVLSQALDDEDGMVDLSQDRPAEPAAKPSSAEKKSKEKDKDKDKSEKERMYYTVSCRDNGCGIPAASIGDMLGRVLSGSKHGLRQTRGKFGLGAKMALIWAKKSSGQPIIIRTAHAASLDDVPSDIATVVLDIDIYKNEPRIISKKIEPNPEGWRGTEISLTMAGQWSIYKAKVMQYAQQLAVITPYADISVEYECPRDEKKYFHVNFERRSEQMPPKPTIMLPHPRSLNNITLSNLLKTTNADTLVKCLQNDLCGISTAVAKKIASSLGLEETSPAKLSSSDISALIQALRDDVAIKPPSSSCLSPAGEYNLRLGIGKELNPTLVATFTDKSGSHEGHPFIVEAAISVGGARFKEGINIFRFANRIPLLFEGGADVVTQVATKKINWSLYHMDPKKDCIGVFVSIVSTKIPFKGTSKEYIGDDVIEIQKSVRRAIQGCCQQLRVNLAKNIAEKEEKERKKNLVKYIPDITRSLMAILGKGIMGPREVSYAGSNYSSSQTSLLGSKRSRVIAELASGNLDEEVLKQRLEAGVERFDAESALLAQLENADSGSTREKVSIIPVPYSDISPDASKRFCLERSTSNVSNTAFSPESNVATDNKSVIDLSQDSNGSADTVMDNICPSTPLSKQKDHSGISEAPNKRWLTINGMKGVLVMIPSLKIESM